MSLRKLYSLDGEINLSVPSIYPLQRESVFPYPDSKVAANPPRFLWPSVYEEGVQFRNITGAPYPTRQHAVRYCFRLSARRDFEKVFHSTQDQPWAFFNPHKRLSPGDWYWQYACSIKASPYQWSPIYRFEVPAASDDFETPSFSELLENTPSEHPRLLIRKSSLPKLRQQWQSAKLSDSSWLDEAEQSLTVPIPEEAEAEPSQALLSRQGISAQGIKKVRNNSARALADLMESHTQLLVQAYLATGDRRYGKAAKAWGLRAASFDPQGPACFSHFADTGHLRSMAWVYDSCYDLLTEEDKDQLQQAICTRAKGYYEEWVNALENLASSCHVWQQLYNYFFEACVAIVGDVPAAQQWFHYAYEVFLAKAPALSDPSDGAWANGFTYMVASQRSILNTALVLSELSGTDFLANAWFSNNAWAVVHACTPGNPKPGFADSYEHNGGHHPLSGIQYMDFLARRKRMLHASWYVQQALATQANLILTVGSNRLLDWFYRREVLPNLPELPKDFAIPQAHLFREVGLAVMHSDVMAAPKGEDVVLYFGSSPFGSVSNHAHSACNAFNIAARGDYLFYSSGYRNIGAYRSTRAENALLIDGQGQVRGGIGYGWLPRYLHGQQITYVLGDASHAYSGQLDRYRQMKNPEGPHDIHSAMKHFRRHVVMLRPNIFIIYDDLKAHPPVTWTWLLHSRYNPIAVNGSQIKTYNKKAAGHAQLFSSTSLELSSHTSTYHPSVDYYANIRLKRIDRKDHHHVQAKNKAKTGQLRLLCIIQVTDRDTIPDEIQSIQENHWQVGPWSISAQMDPVGHADLRVVKNDDSVGLSTSQSELILKGRHYERKKRGSALLVESVEGQIQSKETIDQLPKAVNSKAIEPKIGSASSQDV